MSFLNNHPPYFDKCTERDFEHSIHWKAKSQWSWSDYVFEAWRNDWVTRAFAEREMGADEMGADEFRRKSAFQGRYGIYNMSAQWNMQGKKRGLERFDGTTQWPPASSKGILSKGQHKGNMHYEEDVRVSGLAPIDDPSWDNWDTQRVTRRRVQEDTEDDVWGQFGVSNQTQNDGNDHDPGMAQ